MRKADDISDDPSVPANLRRQKLAAWIEGLRRVVEGERTDDPVFMALADTQKSFNIPFELLQKLVQGTAMDLPERASGAGPEFELQYESFDQLYEYCYHVASVVGLVCIRVFGYRDPHAEKLAEQTGVAFQLTNIIRDVKEDSELGRVYLPHEDLKRFGVEAAALANGNAAAVFRPVLEFEAQRALELYRAAEELMPLIDEDSQPALWALVEVYRRLLERIAARGYDVFTERVKLSTAEKLGILAKGFVKRLT
jgi:phytoene synthase